MMDTEPSGLFKMPVWGLPVPVQAMWHNATSRAAALAGLVRVTFREMVGLLEWIGETALRCGASNDASAPFPLKHLPRAAAPLLKHGRSLPCLSCFHGCSALRQPHLLHVQLQSEIKCVLYDAPATRPEAGAESITQVLVRCGNLPKRS